MPIDVDAGGREFHLHNGRISYIVGVHDNGALGQLYFGPALSAGRSYRHLVPVPFRGFSNRLGAPVALEYPTSGSGDYRVPAIVVGQPDGSTVLELAYVGHRITPGKPAITGLPATYVEADEEADTLEIDVADGPSGAVVTLLYTIFRDVPIVARSVRIRNAGPEALELRCAMSLVLDLPDARWQLVHLGGTWARERHVRTRPLELGRQSISSSRGASSTREVIRSSRCDGPRRARSTAKRSAPRWSTPGISSPRSRSRRSRPPACASGSIPKRSAGASSQAPSS